MRMKTITVFFLPFPCSQQQKRGKTLFQVVDSTGIDFNNRLLTALKQFYSAIFYNGNGVALAILTTTACRIFYDPQIPGAINYTSTKATLSLKIFQHHSPE